jgi:hypothetical protein
VRRVSIAFCKHEVAAGALTTRRRGNTKTKSMPRRDERLGVVAWSRLKGGLLGELRLHRPAVERAYPFEGLAPFCTAVGMPRNARS